jgi:hypothetical protein
VITVSGNRLVPENDSWNGYKALFVTGTEKGTSFTIADSAAGAASDTLTIPTGRLISAGDKFTILTSAGVSVDFIRAGVSIALYGEAQGVYKNESFLDSTNLVETPALDGLYTSNLCENWSVIGSVSVAKSSNPAVIQYGAHSQYAAMSSSGAGLSQSVSVVSGKYYNCQAWVYVVEGVVRFEVTDGVSTWKVSKGGAGWQKYGIVERAGSGTITLKILSDAANTSFYLDAAQVTEGVVNRSFSVNSDYSSLWEATYNVLMSSKNPRVEYEVAFIDLYSIDPLKYQDEQVGLGDKVTVFDRELLLEDVSVRVKRVSMDVFSPENTKYVVNNL